MLGGRDMRGGPQGHGLPMQPVVAAERINGINQSAEMHFHLRPCLTQDSAHAPWKGLDPALGEFVDTSLLDRDRVRERLLDTESVLSRSASSTVGITTWTRARTSSHDGGGEAMRSTSRSDCWNMAKCCCSSSAIQFQEKRASVDKSVFAPRARYHARIRCSQAINSCNNNRGLIRLLPSAGGADPSHAVVDTLSTSSSVAGRAYPRPTYD